MPESGGCVSHTAYAHDLDQADDHRSTKLLHEWKPYKTLRACRNFDSLLSDFDSTSLTLHLINFLHFDEIVQAFLDRRFGYKRGRAKAERDEARAKESRLWRPHAAATLQDFGPVPVKASQPPSEPGTAVTDLGLLDVPNKEQHVESSLGRNRRPADLTAGAASGPADPGPGPGIGPASATASAMP